MSTVKNDNRNRTRVNDQIRAREVQLIDTDGANLGIKDTRDALRIAGNKNLDLVEISPQAKPPVARIMDYGKFKYEQSKRDRDNRKKSHAKALKEVKFSVRIGDEDYKTKRNRVIKFLNQGHKVKLSIQMRGREQAHPELGMNVLKRVVEDCKEHGKAESMPTLNGRQIIAVLGPQHQ